MKHHNEVKLNSEVMTSVYKTTIREDDLPFIKSALDNFEKIINWNTDLEDCDNILRIESQFSVESEVINALSELKIKCIELK